MGACCHGKNNCTLIPNNKTVQNQNSGKKAGDKIANINSHAVETCRFSTLVKRDDDLKAILENIDNFLCSNDIQPREKLRKALLILKGMTEPEEDTFNDALLTKNFKEKFIGLIERHYLVLYETFNSIKEGYKPLINLLQILDLMLINFEEIKYKDLSSDLVNRTYSLIEKTKESDWRLLRKLSDQKLNLNLDHRIYKETLILNFMKKIETIKGALTWKHDRKAVQVAEETILAITTLYEENRELFFDCLVSGRFDKLRLNSEKLSVKGSLILGDEGGLYLLINSVPPNSFVESVIMEAGVSIEFLKDKRNTENNKVILGKGSFGKVRLALSIFGDYNIDVGQLVCLKKSRQIGNYDSRKENINTLANITNSTMEDFFAKKISDSIYAPRPLDMTLLTNRLVTEEKHRKGYLMMEVAPENTADKVFEDPRYQKWEFQKPYILEIMKTMIFLLIENRFFNSDLKPENTLFDPLSRKMAIIDLGSSLLIEKEQDIKAFDIYSAEFGKTDYYCPPEILEGARQMSNQNHWPCDLPKATSYLCGVTISEVISPKPKQKKKFNIDEIALAEKTDLSETSRSRLVKTIKKLLHKNPKERLDLGEAVKIVENIGSDENARKIMYEQYILRVRELVKKSPSSLNLNVDINETISKGIIEQKVSQNNPKRYKNQKTTNIEKEFDEMLLNKENRDSNVFLLLGEAGSGKSLALQLRFIKEVEEWESGKALPIFFNLADEVDLEKVIRRINSNLGCNIKIEAENEKIHLFVDSFDEGPRELIKRPSSSPDSLLESTIIDKYLEKLSSWKVKNFIISCRTDFVLSDGGDDDLGPFKITKSKLTEPISRYIVPIGYRSDTSDLEKLVSKWLEREQMKEKSSEFVDKIKKMFLEEKMRTGLMFNMVMKMLTTDWDMKNSKTPPRGYEIYSSTIKQEIKQNWDKILSQTNHQKKRNQIKLINCQVQNIGFLKIPETSKNEPPEFQMISEGLERIGELIAAEMNKLGKNRLHFSEIEELIKKTENLNDDETHNVRTEWKTLYYILKIMEMKLEKSSSSAIKDHTSDAQKPKSAQELNVGFRHETYKNYYLLRGLIRIFASNNEPNNTDNKFSLELDKKILNSVLNQPAIIRNYELLRLFGEAVRHSKNTSLKEGLRMQLNTEQELNRTNLLKREKCPSAAIVMSILVAAQYSFSDQDLSFLDLTGANMRGGLVYNTNFKKTNLSYANMRHANVSRAQFTEANLQGLDLGIRLDFIGHSKFLMSICFSPDGKLIASGSVDKTVMLWDSTTGNCEKTLTGHADHVFSVCFSPDGKKLVSGSRDNSLKIWGSANWDCEHTLREHSDYVRSVSFSPDGKTIASGSEDKTIKIWKVDSGICENSLLGHSDYIYSVCFSPDGKNIASGSRDCTVKIWDISSYTCLKTLTGHLEYVRSVDFSPDGKFIVSASGDKAIKIWNLANNECIQTLDGHLDSVFSVCFSPDGKKIASGSNDKTIKIWGTSGECLQTLTGHSNCVVSVCFSPDGKKIASGGWDNLGKIWDSESGECVQMLMGHLKTVYAACFSPDGKRFATASEDKTVKIWETSNGEYLQTFTRHLGEVFSVCFSLDGKLVASGSEDTTVEVWYSDTGEAFQTLEGHVGSVESVCFHPDGKIESWSNQDGTKKTWEKISKAGLVQYECTKSDFTANKPEINNTTFQTPNGRLLQLKWENLEVKIWQEEKDKQSPILIMSLKAAPENPFLCNDSVFKDCREMDLVLQKVITQRQGKIL